MKRDLVIGVDLGGTNVNSAVVDDGGRISHRAWQSISGSRTAGEVIDRLVTCVEMTMDSCGRGRVAGVGVGTPGLIPEDSGIVVYAPNVPEWVDLPLQSILRERLGLPVAIENDANAAAIGEHWVGGAAGKANVICITLGTGVGGAIIMNNEVWRGSNGAGGEIGHMTVVENGRMCGCGAPGCLEAYASATAIAEQARELLRGDRMSVLRERSGGDLDRIDAAMVADAAGQGDDTAREVMHRSATLLGTAVSSLTNLLNPELIVIGGGVMKAGDLIFDPIGAEVARRAYKWSAGILRIVPAKLGDDAGIIGAARHFMLTCSSSS
ncbi:MAG: ROK family protein [Gemmatimonadetes bacterium]|nr:ROK family protein [Gemmatimonadota bacterium]